VDQDALTCATVVEMVHAAALIHDDSVDKSDLRRGRPTVNGLWTNEMAIIMGDYLYAQSMALLVRHKLLVAMDVLSRVVAEMSCGEALEFQYAYDLDVTQEQYEELIRYKTGSLIGAATEIGAAFGNGSTESARRLHFRRFGDTIGVAFQIVDDLLDYQGTAQVTGKPVGSDLAEGKVTLPLIAALQRHRGRPPGAQAPRAAQALDAGAVVAAAGAGREVRRIPLRTRPRARARRGGAPSRHRRARSRRRGAIERLDGRCRARRAPIARPRGGLRSPPRILIPG
jgi:octaprenyl-diphosphate synthase